MIGKIERVHLREIWKHEAYDFTTWLQENLDILNDLLDISLFSAEREQSAGSFSVDLVAEDEAGNPVIIENQLEKSNHDHLGKVITYLVAIDAKAAIWIVADPRPEHVGAISWLNESSSANFYLIKVEGVRIGESEPAPLLTLIVGPSEESRQAGGKKKEMAELHSLRAKFWKLLLDKAKKKTKLHSHISPSQYHWIGTKAGISGLGFHYVIAKHEARAELYIYRKNGPENENKQIFDQLFMNKNNIEDLFEGALSWERLDEKRVCRISKRLELGGFRDEAKWPEIQDEMIDTMIRLEKALKPHIAKLKI